jgi:hypothetical protein
MLWPVQSLKCDFEYLGHLWNGFFIYIVNDMYSNSVTVTVSSS